MGDEEYSAIMSKETAQEEDEPLVGWKSNWLHEGLAKETRAQHERRDGVIFSMTTTTVDQPILEGRETQGSKRKDGLEGTEKEMKQSTLLEGRQ
ncbi:hypothetical protein PDE_07142 [Penicillium oxalicum 114-2]|uniref:Uncharacterized protein n=1 Tax=Penicillium oxalicum (strain 114-2 / CGMCC 5302) TaxID=933388 RepID=S8BBD6_PENO1|nr:hypothetical protein PDE_07142 [Penicillium oxalicum 114-2]